MRKIRAFSLLLTAILGAQFVLASCASTEPGQVPDGSGSAEITTTSKTETEKPVEPDSPLGSVTEAVPNNNLFIGGDFDSNSYASMWSTNKQTLQHITDDNGGYVKACSLTNNHAGFLYKPGRTIKSGIYKFTGYFRMANTGELTNLRIIFTDNSSKAITLQVFPTSKDWLKVDTYITLADTLKQVKVCGGPNEAFIQEYLMDNLSLVAVDAIPAGEKAMTSFGNYVTAAQATASMAATAPAYEGWVKPDSYEGVAGIVINQDADGFLGSCSAGGFSVNDLANFARQFKDSQITDYVICINNTNVSYPSEVWDDVLDKYHQTTENGKAVNYKNEAIMKGAYYIYETLQADYIDIWCDTFREIGISPWISVRMNDAHDLTATTSKLLSDYFHNNPAYRRVQHHEKVGYYDNCQNYTLKETREHMLALIDEALGRYDVDGIELDFQREIWLWEIGGEYNGIEILNQFMREVDAVVKKYETQYKHDIKIGVRVASDIGTNYDFGLDVASWAAEGIIDRVSPTGRWATTDNDIPTRLWVSIMKPFGVEVAPCIETNIKSSPNASKTGSHTIETMSAAAASILSQGADKVYLFNFYRGLKPVITQNDRVNSNSPTLNVTSAKGYWNVITTVGSYETVMKMNRKMILTYNDTNQLWVNSNAQLPASGSNIVLRIPIGDVPENAEVTFKFSTTDTGSTPKLFINSKPATYIGTENGDDNVIGASEKLLCYSVPAEALDDMYLVVEFAGSHSGQIKYAEAYIKVAE